MDDLLFAGIISTITNLYTQCEEKDCQFQAKNLITIRCSQEPAKQRDLILEETSKRVETPVQAGRLQLVESTRSGRRLKTSQYASHAQTRTIKPKQKPRPIVTQKFLTPLIYLFCSSKQGRKPIFPQKDVLRRRYHFWHFQYQISPFLYPISSCRMLINDISHFSNHATTIHKSDLKIRASIIDIMAHSPKPDYLASFVL